MTTIERVLNGGSAIDYIISKGWSLENNFDPNTTILHNEFLGTYTAHGHSSTASNTSDECKAKCVILDENAGYLYVRSIPHLRKMKRK